LGFLIVTNVCATVFPTVPRQPLRQIDCSGVIQKWASYRLIPINSKASASLSSAVPLTVPIGSPIDSPIDSPFHSPFHSPPIVSNCRDTFHSDLIGVGMQGPGYIIDRTILTLTRNVSHANTQTSTTHISSFDIQNLSSLMQTIRLEGF
jgi:hypothetical protein